MPYPFQIVQSPHDDHDRVRIRGRGADRSIWISPAEAPADSWMGWSIGHWEGDTLVVTVTDQNDQTWFDRAGDFHSDALKVTERYTPRSADTLMYEATIEDPRPFRGPGRSACRFTGMWKRTRRSWNISAPSSRKMFCTESIASSNLLSDLSTVFHARSTRD